MRRTHLRMSPQATALATILAFAGAVIAPHQVMAQTRPYATTGTYDDVLHPTVGTGTVVDEGNGSYNQLTTPDLTPRGLFPDDIRSADPDNDIPTDLRARTRLASQRAAEDSDRSHWRRNNLSDQNNDNQRTAYIAPYIEASQVVDARISPQHDTFTYTVLGIGVDGSINGRNNQGSVSLRYEQRIGYGNNAGNSNTVSGIVRASIGVVQDVLHFEVGGYANSTHIEGNGSAGQAGLNASSRTQIFSVFGGPTLRTDAGDVKVEAHYRAGYSKIGAPGGIVATNGQTIADIFESSTVQDAGFRFGTRPGDSLPIGVAVEGGHYREDISNLAQKARDTHIRGEVTIPIAGDTALIGGIGYEQVKVSSRDAVRDLANQPVYDGNGRLVTNFAGPEYIALNTEGMIWDVGVMWRPSPRTTLETHVGQRYGQRTGYGMFTYHPNRRSTFNVLAYNNMTGFGGQLTNSLFNTPTQFQTVRDALTGNISSCVNASSGGSCLTGALATVRSTVYRGKGVTATYNIDFGRIQTGLGVGYDRRQYIAAAGTILSPLNGKLDQYYWAAGYISGAIDQSSVFTASLDAYLFQTGAATASDLTGIRASGVYQHLLTKHLTASAALNVDGINRQALDDVWSASGSVGLRYTFN